MLFNSYPFIFAFLPVALVGYYLLNHFQLVKSAKAWMILASFYFYSYWSVKNLPLLVLSILMNFTIGHFLKKEIKFSKPLLFKMGLVFNLGLLFFFKFADVAFANVALPLGISFWTLQQVAFLVDSYEGLAEEKSFLDYCFFVSFFPQLVSGPIVHYSHLMPQLEDAENRRFNVNRFSLGVFLFSLGLVKKVLISEAFLTWAKPGFDELPSLDFLAAWKTSLSYTFQLYFDFSGYTDMAIGLGHMFNLHLPQNFNSPFHSKSVIEFWTRWHMTLSQFITTYIFTPILRAMPKVDFRNSMIATFLAMFIAGIWHGAGWTFALYGALHGIALVVNHKWKKNKKNKNKIKPWLAVFLTFNFVNITFVVFRAKTLADAWKVLKGMLGLSGVIVPRIGIKSVGALSNYGFKVGTYLYPADYFLILTFVATYFVIWKAKNSLQLEKEVKPDMRLGVLCGVTFVLCLFGMNRITEFIYFNF